LQNKKLTKKCSAGSAACLLLFGNPTGIDGTAVLPLKGSSAVYLLVPNGVAPSSLVGVYTKLVESADPVITELDALNDLRNQLEVSASSQIVARPNFHADCADV